jgi:hypothetical protein
LNLIHSFVTDSDPSLIAVGDAAGVISIFQVSPGLAHQKVDEKAALDRLAAAGVEDNE